MRESGIWRDIRIRKTYWLIYETAGIRWYCQKSRRRLAVASQSHDREDAWPAGISGSSRSSHMSHHDNEKLNSLIVRLELADARQLVQEFCGKWYGIVAISVHYPTYIMDYRCDNGRFPVSGCDSIDKDLRTDGHTPLSSRQACIFRHNQFCHSSFSSHNWTPFPLSYSPHFTYYPSQSWSIHLLQNTFVTWSN